jgi:hypothetical protein
MQRVLRQSAEAIRIGEKDRLSDSELLNFSQEMRAQERLCSQDGRRCKGEYIRVVFADYTRTCILGECVK